MVSLSSTGVEERYGKILFGGVRGLDEKDTSPEAKDWKKVYEFTKESYGDRTKPDFIKLMDSLMLAKTKFPKVLKPVATTAWRGFYEIAGDDLLQEELDIKDFLTKKKNKNRLPYAIFDVDWKTIYKTTSPKTNTGFMNTMKKGIKIKYKPLYVIESWSQDQKIAENFAEESVGGIIIKTKTDSKFIFNHKFLNKHSYGSGESEMLRIQKNRTPFQCVGYISSDDIQYMDEVIESNNDDYGIETFFDFLQVMYDPKDVNSRERILKKRK